MTEQSDPGGIWCRKCGSLEYDTTKTYPCLEGTYRVHRCEVCGCRFGSLATYFDAGTHGADASGRFTHFRDVALPVQRRG